VRVLVESESAESADARGGLPDSAQSGHCFVWAVFSPDVWDVFAIRARITLLAPMKIKFFPAPLNVTVFSSSRAKSVWGLAQVLSRPSADHPAP